jgi:hypothetical protein
MNTPENPDSPVMNTPGSGLLGVLYRLSMLLNIGKRLLSVQNNLAVMNTLGSEYTGESQLPVVNTLMNLNFPVMNILVRRLFSVLLTSTRTGLQKNFLVRNSSGVKTPQCIHHRGVLPT